VYETLITPTELSVKLQRPGWRVIDCRFTLASAGATNAAEVTGQGRRLWQEAHIPGAVYAHLDEDLSGPIVPGRTGRHPLPDREALARRFGDWGITPDCQVVAYDDAGGAFAARLWWLLRWMGHRSVAVLDGGWSAWPAADLPTEAETASAIHPVKFQIGEPLVATVDAQDLLGPDGQPVERLLDARGVARFAGEVEPIDPVAGHIPGALCAPFTDNLRGGRFLSPTELQARFVALLDPRGSDHTVCYCGSGVTAAHNILAAVHASLSAPKLYAGSWSEWITDPARPVATGAN